MLEIRYSLNEAIDISGSWKDVEAFRQEVLKFIQTDLKGIHIETEANIKSAPWDFIASGLQLIQNDESVKVSVTEDKVIIIEGSKVSLEKFASFLEFEENASIGSHSHYEHYEGNEWITADSIPLIIGIK